MPDAGTVRRSVTAVASNRPLLRLEGAYGLFAVYEMGLWVAVLLWAYDVGGAGYAGVASLVMLVPAALLAPVGGVFADRLRHDAALRLGYVAQTVAMAALALLLAFSAPDAAVLAAAAVWCVLVAWTRPAHYAAAAGLSRTPADAAAANSLSGTLQGAGYFAGPVVAGVSAGLGGPTLAAVAFTVMGAAAALLLTGVRLGAPARHVHRTGGRERPFVAELGRRPAVAVVLLVVGVEFVAEGCLQLLAITFTSVRLDAGAAAAGILIGAQGLGGVVGAAAAIVLVRWHRLSGAVAASLAGCALPLLLLLLVGRLLPAVVLVALVGAAMAFFGVAGVTLLQRAVPDALMARILALRESAFIGGFAIGAAITPWLVRTFGAAGAYAALGALLALLATATVPAVVRVDRAAKYRPQLLALLHRIGFLGVLGTAPLERLAHGAVEVTVTAGTEVVREGEQGDAWFLVADGALAVSVAGVAATVELAPGSGFGEIALLRRVPRTATVTALTDARLWRVDRDLFLATVAGSAGHDVAERHVDDQLGRLSTDAGA